MKKLLLMLTTVSSFTTSLTAVSNLTNHPSNVVTPPLLQCLQTSLINQKFLIHEHFIEQAIVTNESLVNIATLNVLKIKDEISVNISTQSVQALVNHTITIDNFIANLKYSNGPRGTIMSHTEWLNKFKATLKDWITNNIAEIKTNCSSDGTRITLSSITSTSDRSINTFTLNNIVAFIDFTPTVQPKNYDQIEKHFSPPIVDNLKLGISAHSWNWIQNQFEKSGKLDPILLTAAFVTFEQNSNAYQKNPVTIADIKVLVNLIIRNYDIIDVQFGHIYTSGIMIESNSKGEFLAIYSE